MRFALYSSHLFHVKYVSDIFMHTVGEEFSKPVILRYWRPDTSKTTQLLLQSLYIKKNPTTSSAKIVILRKVKDGCGLQNKDQATIW